MASQEEFTRIERRRVYQREYYQRKKQHRNAALALVDIAAGDRSGKPNI